MNVFPSKIEQWFSITWYRFSLILDLWQKTPKVIHCWKWFIWLSDCWSYFLWTFHQPYQIRWTFFRRKPVSLQSICLITVHLAFRSVKWFGSCFTLDKGSFHGTYFDGTQFHELYQSNSIRLISNRFNWFPWIFFQSKRDPRNLKNQCNRFPRKSYPQSFNFFHDFPINSFCSQGLPISGKSFFGSHRI